MKSKSDKEKLKRREWIIDPPSGWKYGFPKKKTDIDKPLLEWLLENGYPQKEIDLCGDQFYVRYISE